MTRHRWLPCLALSATALTGCGDIWLQDSYDVLLRQSPPQTMIVTNSGTTPLTIGAGSAAETINPSSSLSIRFRVESIGTLRKPNGTPYWTVLQDQYRQQFVELASSPRVDASGDPLVLKFHDGSRPVFLPFSLNLCAGQGWQSPVTSSTTYRLAVPAVQAAIPQALCPP